MKKLTSLLLALMMLFTALTLSGCPYTSPDHPIRIRISSDKETFSIDNMVIDMEYGFHKLTLWGTTGKNPKQYFPKMDDETFADSHELIFDIYVAEMTKELSLQYPDIRNMEEVEGVTYIKTISEEEAFLKEYGYHSGTMYLDYQFNHKEQIKIPSEYFGNDQGKIWVMMVCYYKSIDSDKPQHIQFISRGSFFYHKSQEDIVNIQFEDLVEY